MQSVMDVSDDLMELDGNGFDYSNPEYDHVKKTNL
jgi:hypothetical protein